VSTQLKALELWRQTLVMSVHGDAPDLSARQLALLLSVYLGQGPHTVRGLAHALNISKPAVSRALDRLGELSYIRRERDDLDRRNVLVQRTQPGADFLTFYADLVLKAETQVAQLSDGQPLDFALEAVTATVASMGAPAEAPAETQAWPTDVAA